MHNEALQIKPEFMLMSDVGWGPRTAPEKLVTRKTKWLEDWNFQFRPLVSGKGGDGIKLYKNS